MAPGNLMANTPLPFILLALTLRKAYFEGIPYSMGWWAFTFPLGAYTLATRLLYAQRGVTVLSVICWILLANLSVFWLITAYRTSRFVLRRSGTVAAIGEQPTNVRS